LHFARSPTGGPAANHAASHANPPMMQQPRRNFLLLLLLLIVLSCSLIESTDIKWTPGQNDPSEAAQTAPKSQKYWDDHGIKRPDYAKTDAEIANERGGDDGSGKWLLLAPFLVAAGYLVHVRMGGHRLGGSHALFFHRVSEEEARQARLARFERGMESGKAE
jgi:hypothetical protein